MIFGSLQTKLNAQSQAGQGDFNIPELKVVVTDPSACNTSDGTITISEPLGSKIYGKIKTFVSE